MTHQQKIDFINETSQLFIPLRFTNLPAHVEWQNWISFHEETIHLNWNIMDSSIIDNAYDKCVELRIKWGM